MAGKEQALTTHQRHWLEQIRACEASGKSVPAYATEVADTQWRIRLPNDISVEHTGNVDAGPLSSVLNTVARLE